MPADSSKFQRTSKIYYRDNFHKWVSLHIEVFKKDNRFKFLLEELETSAKMGSGILNFSKFDIKQFREAAKVVLKAKEHLENLPIPERNAWFESHGFIGVAYDNEGTRCVKKILEQLVDKLVEDPRWE